MQNVLVTGGMGGIGRAACEHFAKNGYGVIIADHPSVMDDGFTEHLTQTHDIEARFHHVNVTNPDDCENLARKVGPIDILINNAGITQDRLFVKMDKNTGKVESIMSPRNWQTIISVNLNGPAYMTMAFIGQMYERKSGSIVFVSSVNGQRPQIGQTNYCASKAGLSHFARTLAAESCRHGVTVGIVAPGYTATPMVEKMPEHAQEAMVRQIPMKRLATPEEIAETIFISATTPYLAGTTLSPNGGLHAT